MKLGTALKCWQLHRPSQLHHHPHVAGAQPDAPEERIPLPHDLPEAHRGERHLPGDGSEVAGSPTGPCTQAITQLLQPLLPVGRAHVGQEGALWAVGFW